MSSQSLETALELLVGAGCSLPVQDPDTDRLVGWLSDHDALSSYTRALAAGIAGQRKREPDTTPPLALP